MNDDEKAEWVECDNGWMSSDGRALVINDLMREGRWIVKICGMYHGTFMSMNSGFDAAKKKLAQLDDSFNQLSSSLGG